MKEKNLNSTIKLVGVILLVVSVVVFFAGIGIQAGVNGSNEVIKVNELLSASTTLSKLMYGNTVVSASNASAIKNQVQAFETQWQIEPDIRMAETIEAVAKNTDTLAVDPAVKNQTYLNIFNNREQFLDETGAVDTAAVLQYVADTYNDGLETPLVTEDVQKVINRKLNVLKNSWADKDAADPNLVGKTISIPALQGKLNTMIASNTIIIIALVMLAAAAFLLIVASLTKQKLDGTAVKRFFRTDEITTLIPLLAVILITTIFRPDFLSVRNFSAMFTQIPFIAICALGASFPLMVGHVDISTGRVAGFAGIMMATLILDHGVPTVWSILLALLACVVIGLWNGFLVVKMDIPDFVATMGTLYIIGGARYLFIHGYELTLGRLENFHLDEIFDARYMGMPLYFWIMLLLFAIMFVVIKKMVWGRHLLAVGDNREVANLVGINANKMRMAAYSICSVLAGIAGILLVLDTSFAKPEYGDGWEFRAIAGCVVGGVSLSGGKCSPLGILIGVTLVFVAENAIIFLGLPSTMREAVKGFLMAAAVLFDIFRNSRKVSA